MRNRREAELGEQIARGSLAARVAPDEHVLEHGHGREELDVLKRPRDPPANDPMRRRAQKALTVEGDLAGVRPVEPGDQIEERGLAGAVRPDQACDLAALDAERDVIDGDDTAKAPRHVLEREEGHRALP